MRQWARATRKKCKFVYLRLDNFLPHIMICFDADPDLAQTLDADPNPDPWGGGGRSAKNVHPPWQNPRYAPGSRPCRAMKDVSKNCGNF
jgi:hypothetical protein